MAGSETNVAIIGAGPYGLSVAAYLRAAGIEHRIFGRPMSFWAEHMPKGMLLKSEGFASNLYDPQGAFTLGQFCNESRIEYADVGIPVRLDTFCAYGLAFQRRFVPELQDKALESLSKSRTGFLLKFDDGASVTARKVVLATGIGHFQHVPKELAQLPSHLVSHSSWHNNLEQFKNRDVVVIGGGASASDLAVLLHESGARVDLIARLPSIQFHDRMRLPRSPRERLRSPMSTIGPGWRSLLYAGAPSLFHWLPQAARLRVVKSHLGPAGGWFMKDRFTKVPHLLGHRIKQADHSKGRVHLQLTAENGIARELWPEHVIAATGYRPDLCRLPFLSAELSSQLRSVDNAPVLSASFESSLPGLYFVGAIAANSFGPVMRFAAGARFAARQISKSLTRTGFAIDAFETSPASSMAN